ncbi:MAG: type I-E CRISPR-associated protein Cas5/CasD [Prevotella sp.]|nr:type I-E CRISPR-associated protein Cas5/CasD [Alistipes senegalensis]MCM1357981.1 type I-E CRISPR-associated protein Cas5/CasD [Prevotella sp.]
MATLLLRLAGPLQSWGCESKFEVRRTMNFPTKSGVIGMIAAAMGYSREDSLDELNKLKFGVRIDHEGKLIRDYQIALDKKFKNPYVTNRYYLSDAIFLVGLESNNEDFLNNIENALKNPAFPLFLGRRSCPPTMPLVLGLRNSTLINSLKNEKWLMEEWRQKRIYDESECKLRIIIESNDNDGDLIHDAPVSFNPVYRKFSWRSINDCEYIDKSSDIKPTEHDAMSELR